ncbi:MAG: hypothetical protein K0R91_778, partial [Nitrososphaeraceae archaeon]|nr:hypothetical protein [Nitrososphaeraceae archaeon]
LPLENQGLFLPPADNATEQQTQDGGQGLLPPTDQEPQLPPPQVTGDNVNEGLDTGESQPQQGGESGSEICDDGADNDGDGLIDISDQDCITESEADGAEQDGGLPTEETEQQIEGGGGG